MLQSPVDPQGSSNLASAREEVNRFTKLLMRTKTIASQRSCDDAEGSEPDQVEGQLQKVLTTADLISLGVGSCCGTGMYVVAGFVARTIAGPAVVLSFVIAAIASILSGVCYGEFGVRVPKTTGSAYMYSYVAVGEFVAFLLGWNMILEYVIGSAAGASAISVCFDALTNHSMSTYLEENVGTVIGKSYPDFVGFGVGLGMTVILAAGVRGSVRFNNILNGINFVVWVFIMIAGLVYVDSNNWNLYGFAPNGASGVFTGAATCFYAFIGFDIIGTTGEEAKNPSRSIPIAIISSLCICLFSYVTVSVILTLVVPYYDVEPGSALVDMFVQRGFYSAKFIVAIGAVAALVVSLLGSMFPMPRIIYAMARDGLLFEFLGRVHQRTGTPLVATILTGSAASLMSLLVSLEVLIEMMSIGTLFAYSLVSISVLLLRYQPDKHDLPIPLAHRTDPDPEDTTSPRSSTPSYGYDDDYPAPGSNGEPTHQGAKRRYKDDQHLIPTANDDHRSYYGSVGGQPGRQCMESKVAAVRRHAKMCWLRLGFPGDEVRPTDATARTVIIFTGLLCLAELAACVTIVFGGWRMEAGEVWVVLLVIVFVAAAIGCLAVILRQPQNKCKVDFKAPLVPFLPATAVFVNLYLALNLPVLTWMRLGVWICIGLLLYFGYSMVHSVKAQKSSQNCPSAGSADDQSKKTAPNDNMDTYSTKDPANTQLTSFAHQSNGLTSQSATGPDYQGQQPPRRPPPPRQESLSKYKANRGQSSVENNIQPETRHAIYQPNSNPMNHTTSHSTDGSTIGMMEHRTGSRDSSQLSSIARPRPRPQMPSNDQNNPDVWSGSEVREFEADSFKASNPFRESRDIEPGTMRAKNPFRE